MLYRGMDKAALTIAYDNGVATGLAERDRIMADFAQRGAALLAAPGVKRDLRYGDAPRERIDFFPCGTPSRPTLVWIHGGYWQRSDKENYAALAAGPLAHGINVAMIEYTLAPGLTMDGIVAQVRRAVAYVLAHLGEFGAATDGVFVAGHSAGGHLTAMAMTEPGVLGAIPISGLFDLEAIRLGTINDAIHMDWAEAQRNSPLHYPPSRKLPVVVAVGGGELPELRRQSQDYHALLTTWGFTATHMPLGTHNHFSVLEELAQPDGKLTAALLGLIKAVGR